jgi:transcription elongation factor S-II
MTQKSNLSQGLENEVNFSYIISNLLQKRAKIVTVLLNSLKNGDLPEHTQDPELVATRIEAALFDRFGDVNNDYYSAARSRASNLRDKKNPDLRENVLTGAVSAERFASMTTDEMASDEMKKQRESFTKEAISEHQLSMQEGTPSDMFRCGRCGKNNCTYTQLQTRSSDEPMTTFVFCRTCGNRWKLY